MTALFVLLPLSLGTWASYRSPRFAKVSPYLGAGLVTGTVPWTGGSSSVLFPYLIASGLSLGLTVGTRELFLMTGGASAVLLLGALLMPGPGGTLNFLGVSTQWVLLSLALGLVAVWSRSLLARPTTQVDEYREVRTLLEQLRSRTRNLPGSLDTAETAQALLGRCARVAAFGLGAVLVESGEGVFVPLAVTGATRVPWRDPLAADGPLRSAWLSGQPTLDRRRPDAAGRRRGGALLALPLLASHGPFGLLILESAEVEDFPDDVVARLGELASAAAPQLETSVLYEEVRLEASVEERDRLARQMHDGIAQELASLGYQLDDLRLRANALDPELAERAGEVRRSLTTLISDLRLSITDLRTTLGPERGLGAVLSTYLRAVCSGRELILTLSLQETAFRLPADQEAGLLRVAHAFAQEVRQTKGVAALTVRLVVDPPSASLHLTCDGPLPGLREDEVRNLVERIGGDMSQGEQLPGETSLTIRLRGGTDGDDRAAGGRSRADSTGAAASVRAD